MRIAHSPPPAKDRLLGVVPDPDDPGRGAFSGLRVRDRQHDPGRADRGGGPALPARLAAGPGQGEEPAVLGRDQPEASRAVADDRRQAVPGGADPLAAGAARRAGDAPGKVRAPRGDGGAARAPAPPPQGRDVEPPGPARRSLARPGHADAADRDPERDGRARRVRRQPRGDPPRRVGQDRVGRPEAAPVRGDGAGRRLRPPALQGTVDLGDRPRHPGGRRGAPGALGDASRTAAGRAAAQGQAAGSDRRRSTCGLAR